MKQNINRPAYPVQNANNITNNGLTKLEQVSTQILCAMIATGKINHEYMEEATEHALRYAKNLLMETEIIE